MSWNVPEVFRTLLALYIVAPPANTYFMFIHVGVYYVNSKDIMLVKGCNRDLDECKSDLL